MSLLWIRVEGLTWAEESDAYHNAVRDVLDQHGVRHTSPYEGGPIHIPLETGHGHLIRVMMGKRNPGDRKAPEGQRHWHVQVHRQPREGDEDGYIGPETHLYPPSDDEHDGEGNMISSSLRPAVRMPYDESPESAAQHAFHAIRHTMRHPDAMEAIRSDIRSQRQS